MIIALKKSKFLSNFVKHADWLIGEQVTSCLGKTYKINNVDVFDSDLVKILVVRLYKYMNDENELFSVYSSFDLSYTIDVRNNIIEIEDHIKTDRDLKIMKEMLKAFDYIMTNDQPANN
jgi:hypothetical protein